MARDVLSSSGLVGNRQALSLGNCTVVSADSDLLAIPRLTVENWAE
jgi:hypothetical protein